ncbi:acetylglutamate kinase [Marvinbryantia formatexigens DSM 14469]|uniref:Acetylglutamate kinase n=1 Tax=Marvinbryantia formatexigens DSM 14469 TaxID=478749 RepID=C6LGL5_9FIRM|nr:acetylglutamate kinase [Marvinbryantia formatexigens]EET60215.1 acetylglutamate kinase [Marvinbryantia formatexigens DSM 14469]
MESMENWLQKAEVLNEALPYIQRFHGKIMVVKYGGSAMVDHELKKSVIRDVALLKLVGFRPIIVHGGGKEITKWVNKAGLETRFVNGLRVTDKETMEIAEMVLNRINKGLVSMMEKLGVHAVGISGKDGTLLRVEKKLSKGQDIGYVGEIKKVNTGLLEKLLNDDFVPVICPIGSDDAYHSYNINADDAACAIASAMGATKLAFLTDIEGVYRNPLDKILADFRDDDPGGGGISGERHGGRRNAAEAAELYRGDEGGRFPRPYSGRAYCALPASGILHGPRRRYRYHK